MESVQDNKYLLIDDKGMVIEQNEAFNDNILGDICDIIHKGKKVTQENETVVSIQFEKSNLVIVNDSNKKLSVCSLSNKNNWLTKYKNLLEY